MKRVEIAELLGCNKSTVSTYTKENFSKREYNKTRRNSLKLMSIEYKGGKCSICGYDKCVDALDFHHLDPSTKDERNMVRGTRSFSAIKEELDKCILLCSNCHRETHYNLRNGGSSGT